MGEMVIKTHLKTLLEIFCESMLHSEIIFKSIAPKCFGEELLL